MIATGGSDPDEDLAFFCITLCLASDSSFRIAGHRSALEPGVKGQFLSLILLACPDYDLIAGSRPGRPNAVIGGAPW